jgi:GTPase-activating protein SAC7
MMIPFDQHHKSGYVPIVVAKCGLFLKDNGTETEGVFRVSGSAKRMKELQTIFDSPPKYGKDLVWTTYSVHDAASVFRRYLCMIPVGCYALSKYNIHQYHPIRTQ